jgi:two-component system, cell cycle sensor histidine kinase and response regulator CckA
MIAGIKVLVVDDEDLERSAVTKVLKAHFSIVLEANSYADAMEMFERSRGTVDLLVADVVLPDGNGCDLALALHQQQPNLRVLFMSWHVGAEACKYYGLDLNNLHFLKKPFTERQLVSRIEQVMASKEGFPELAAPKIHKSSTS